MPAVGYKRWAAAAVGAQEPTLISSVYLLLPLAILSSAL